MFCWTQFPRSPSSFPEHLRQRTYDLRSWLMLTAHRHGWVSSKFPSSRSLRSPSKKDLISIHERIFYVEEYVPKMKTEKKKKIDKNKRRIWDRWNHEVMLFWFCSRFIENVFNDQFKLVSPTSHILYLCFLKFCSFSILKSRETKES